MPGHDDCPLPISQRVQAQNSKGEVLTCICGYSNLVIFPPAPKPLPYPPLLCGDVSHSFPGGRIPATVVLLVEPLDQLEPLELIAMCDGCLAAGREYVDPALVRISQAARVADPKAVIPPF